MFKKLKGKCIKTSNVKLLTMFFIFLFASFTFIAPLVLASPIDFTPAIQIGEQQSGPVGPDGIAQYIKNIYRYSVGIGAIVATVLLMFGGIRWITAGGNSSSIDSAKSWIISSITGLLLLMFTYTILYLINPDLVHFSGIQLETVDPKDTNIDGTMGCCEILVSPVSGVTHASRMTGASCSQQGGSFDAHPRMRPNDDSSACVDLCQTQSCKSFNENNCKLCLKCDWLEGTGCADSR